jgi:hypothetical protein
MRKLALLLLSLSLVTPLLAQTKTLLNLDQTGVAIQGYDPVAFLPKISLSKEERSSRASMMALLTSFPRNNTKNSSIKNLANTNLFSAVTVLMAFPATN